jgi:hypothetical protein
MSDQQIQAANLIPPLDDTTAVVALTTSSQELDLSTRTELQLKAGRFVTLMPDQDCWINLGDASSGSVDETAVTGATQGWYLPGGSRIDVLYNEVYKYLRFKGIGASFLRMYVSSRSPTESA